MVAPRFICERVNARWAPKAETILRLAISANKSRRLLKELPPKALNPSAAHSKEEDEEEEGVEGEEGLGASDVFHVLYFSLSLSLSPLSSLSLLFLHFIIIPRLSRQPSQSPAQMN